MIIFLRILGLTSVVGISMESIIANKIGGHLDKHNFINHSQYGFMEEKSYLTNLLSFYDTVYEAVYKNESYDKPYLDFSNGFAKVTHQRLLRVCRMGMINGKLSRWIKLWLSNKHQSCNKWL